MSGGNVIVKRLERSDAGRWDEFVRAAPGGTFYHLAGWMTLIENQLGHTAHYLYCETEGEISAVLPLARVRSWLFGDALISTPFLVYGGPVYRGDDSLQAILAAARELAEELGVDYLELRNRKPIDGNWHANDTHVTFRKRIDPDPEANLLAIPRKQRAMVRKGIQFGLEAVMDHDADRLYKSMLVCKRNLGTPFFGKRWLQAIKDEFGDQAEIMTITSGGDLVCSVMSFRFRNEILPYYGGGGDKARDLKGNDFMYWAVMEQACRTGVEIFDYGRSKEGTGAYRFKKHWGFEPEPLHYRYHLVKASEVPNLSPTNPRYEQLIAAWKRLPLPVAAIVGPPLARRLA